MVLLANALLLLLTISMVKVHQLHLTFLVLVMIKLVLLSYSTSIKRKELTVLSLYVVTYLLVKSDLANFLMLKI
ncbi:hypothetical protein D3C85_1863650 [compost metagenome]